MSLYNPLSLSLRVEAQVREQLALPLTIDQALLVPAGSAPRVVIPANRVVEVGQLHLVRGWPMGMPSAASCASVPPCRRIGLRYSPD